jgi:signal transduction histidine kinase
MTDQAPVSRDNDVILPGAGKRVLIVDDEPDFCQGLSDVLQAEGYDTVTAHSTADALSKIVSFDAQVAILDYRLGSECGLDLVDPLKRRRPEMLFIVSTGDAEFETVIASLRHGVYDYFRKPLNLKGFLTTLDRCFWMVKLAGEKRLAEQQLVEAKKVEAVAQVAGGVAHHFNNILAVIQGRLDLLTEGLGKDNDHYQHIESMQLITQRAASINQSLLAYTGQQIVFPRPNDLARFIRQNAADWQGRISDKITMEIDLTDDLPLVPFDPAQLESALWHLLKNAEDAMPNGGTVTISAKPGDPTAVDPPLFSALADRGFVTITVSDTGTGMSAEVARNAFEPFFSERGLAEREGLGLGVVYGVIKQLGGEVKLESEVGQGTTMSLHLPWAEQGADANDAKAPQESPD